MRKILYLLILICSSCHSPLIFDENGQCVNAIPSGEKYMLAEMYTRHNCDESANDIYAVETLEYDSTKYKTLVGDHKHIFVVSNDYLTYQHDTTEKVILQDWNSAILKIEFSEYCQHKSGFYYPDEKVSGLKIRIVKTTIDNRTYKVAKFIIPPKFFRVYLIRGYVYDQLYGPVMDGVRRRKMDFPEPNAFYKVYVPVWESDGRERVDAIKFFYGDEPWTFVPEKYQYFYKHKEKLLRKYLTPKYFR